MQPAVECFYLRGEIGHHLEEGLVEREMMKNQLVITTGLKLKILANQLKECMAVIACDTYSITVRTLTVTE